VSQGSAQTFEQLLLRANYAAGSKVDVALELGGELRHIENGTTMATPVFSLQAIYTPYDLLRVRVDAYRRAQPSIINSGANTVLTGVGLDLRYRFLQRWEVGVGAAYEHTDYKAIGGPELAPRADDYFLLRLSQGYLLTEYSRVLAFYQYRTNNSTQANRSFDNQQAGLELSVTY
jgi:hypothetical protein